MTFDLFDWLGADQTRYMLVSQVGVFALALCVAAGACSERFAAFLASRRGIAAFFAMMCFALLASRWPTLFMGLEEINRDQADFIAAARTAMHHPVPWRDFDPLTSGPFNVYVLLLPLLVGQAPSFLTTSILTLAMQFATLAATYAAIARCFDARIARLGTLAPAVFLCVTVQQAYLQYATETLSVLLCAVALCLLARAGRHGFGGATLFAIGILCGIVPFAKLQSTPLAATLAIVTFALLACARTLSIGERVRRAAILASGLALVPCALLASLAAYGVFGDFWTSYIGTAIGYVQLPEYRPLTFLIGAPEFGRYFDFLLAVTAIGAIAALVRPRAIGGPERAAYVVALAMLAAAVYCIFAPRRGTVAYLVYGIFPIATASAVAIASLARVVRTRAATAVLSVAFVVAALGFDGAFVRTDNFWASTAYPTYRQGIHDTLVSMIQAHLEPGERLAIWGYHPEYVIYTNTILGTRDPNTFDQFASSFNPNREYYRARFVRDMRTNRPEGFLDAGTVSFDRDDTSRSIYEAWTELAAVVDTDYVLVGQWQRYRFFVRRDLAKRRRGSANG